MYFYFSPHRNYDEEQGVCNVFDYLRNLQNLNSSNPSTTLLNKVLIGKGV